MGVVIHFDEIFLKGNNQLFFCRCLISNLNSLFHKAKAERVEGGLWLDNISAEDLPRLGLVPGIANFAPAIRADNSLSEIKNALLKLDFAETVKKFRITANRSSKKYAIKSKDLEIALGDFIREKKGWKVDLTDYDVEIRVDVGAREAFVYGNALPGVGGLPTGTSGKILCLLSGGIDSPVAAYELMKRGAEVALVHFQNETKVTEEVSAKIIDLAKVLAGYQPRVKLFIVPFANLQRQVIMKIPAKYRMITTRRLMFKIAEQVAGQEKCLALGTGDSLGQVASQTLENMGVIYEATPLLKTAPLIGRNKKEIMALARRIGTLAISERPYEDCCSLFVARHPETKARLNDVLKLESALDLSTLDKDLKEMISYSLSID